MSKALQLKNATPDKKFYIFAYDTLDIPSLENFPFVQCWVNTACPRIADEKSFMVNIGDLLTPDMVKF